MKTLRSRKMKDPDFRPASLLAALCSAVFDPATFLNTTFSDANATVLVPCPPGEYIAMIDDVKARAPAKADGSPMLDVYWKIDGAQYPDVKSKTGRDTIRVRQTCFLDFDDNGALSFADGKNVQLGRVRDAVGQNQKGQPWQPAMLKGGGALIRVTNRPSGKPGDDTIYDDVGGVTKL